MIKLGKYSLSFASLSNGLINTVILVAYAILCISQYACQVSEVTLRDMHISVTVLLEYYD